MATTFDEALRAAQRWTDLDGVQAVGQGKTEDGRDCILVLVSVKTEAVARDVPDTFEGVPVRIEESGVIQAG